MGRYFRYALYLFIISFISCTDLEENDPLPSDDVFIANGEIQKINTSAGDRDVSLALTNGLQLNLRIHFPQDIEGAPLILALHWEGDETAYTSYADCQAIPGLSHTNAIIVAPSIAGAIWWETRTEILLLDLIDKITEGWPINNSKVAITGFSNGAIASWLYAAAHPDIFSAAVPVAGGYAQDVAFQIPLYVIHSLDDEVVPFEGVLNVVNVSIGRGSDINLVLVEQLSHLEGCNYTTHLEGAGNWLLDEVWN